mmetsp:Transcript_54417/g.156483  ORF Transcript_54417/g.156483 Transcript_54417/m.156483 type:complete len:260 (+) Transcript_54417:476-1255(+)
MAHRVRCLRLRRLSCTLAFFLARKCIWFIEGFRHLELRVGLLCLFADLLVRLLCLREGRVVKEEHLLGTCRHRGCQHVHLPLALAFTSSEAWRHFGVFRHRVVREKSSCRTKWCSKVRADSWLPKSLPVGSLEDFLRFRHLPHRTVVVQPLPYGLVQRRVDVEGRSDAQLWWPRSGRQQAHEYLQRNTRAHRLVGHSCLWVDSCSVRPSDSAILSHRLLSGYLADFQPHLQRMAALHRLHIQQLASPVLLFYILHVRRL